MNGIPAPTDSPALPSRPTWVRWRIVLLLMAFSFLSWFLRKSMGVAADERIMQEFGIAPEAMGYVYSAFLFVYMLCMTPGGWVIDRWGPKRALLLMGVGLAFFGALTGLVGPGVRLWAGLSATAESGLAAGGLALVLFLVIRSLMGATAAPMYPASAHLIARWLPLRRRGWANGLVQGSAALGIACTPVLFGFLIDRFDWPQAFLAAAGCTALLTLLWSAWAADRPDLHPGVNAAELQRIEESDAPVRQDVARESAAPLPPWWHLLGNRSLVLMTLSYAAVGYFEYLFFFWMGYYFKEILKIDDSVRRVYEGIPLLAMAAAMPLGGWLSDQFMKVFGYRIGRALVPVGGMIAGAVLLVLGVQATDPVWIVTCFALSLGAVGAVEAPFWTTAAELGGRRGGTAAAICNTGGNAGLLAPILTPLVSARLTPLVGERLAWQYAICLGAAVCLVGACLWLWIDPRERVAEPD